MPPTTGTFVAALPTPRTSEPLGATVPASSPGTFALLRYTLAVSLQLRAPPSRLLLFRLAYPSRAGGGNKRRGGGFGGGGGRAAETADNWVTTGDNKGTGL